MKTQTIPMPATWKRLAPGVYADDAGGLHLAVPELIEANGWPDNAHNRQMIVDAARRMFPHAPKAQVVE